MDQLSPWKLAGLQWAFKGKDVYQCKHQYHSPKSFPCKPSSSQFKKRTLAVVLQADHLHIQRFSKLTGKHITANHVGTEINAIVTVTKKIVIKTH